MNTELLRVMDLINANKLSLNIDKTKCMMFHTKGRHFSLNVDVYEYQKNNSKLCKILRCYY